MIRFRTRMWRKSILFAAVLWCSMTLMATACGDPTRLYKWASERFSLIRRDFDDPCTILEGATSSFEKITGKRPAVQVFLFQNNERELLADWLQYHAHLFGVKSINVVDHNSTDPQVCHLLALYSYCGAKVTHYEGPFGHKHGALTDAMKPYRSTFLIPLDADEFVVSFKVNERGNKTEVVINRSAILNEIAQSPLDGRKYKFNGVHPVRHTAQKCTEAFKKGKLLSSKDRRVMAGGYVDPTQYEPYITKTFFYSRGFIATDQGNHYGKVLRDRGVYVDHPLILENIQNYFYFMPTVSLVHYHVMSVAHVRAKLERGALAYRFDINKGCGEPRTGDHYCHVAREYMQNTAKAKAHYMYLCQRSTETGPTVQPLTEWFARYAMTMDDLVGDV